MGWHGSEVGAAALRQSQFACSRKLIQPARVLSRL